MPPRRSVRSKVSAPPQSRSPSPETHAPRSRQVSTSKRKRDVPVEVEENEKSISDVDTSVELPARRSSRARSKPPSQETLSKSSKAKDAVKASNSIETIEEEQDAPSPPKRAKNESPAEAEADDSEEDVVVRPSRRGSRKPSSKAVGAGRSAPSKRSRTKAVIEEEDEHIDSANEVGGKAGVEDSDKSQTIESPTLDSSNDSLPSATAEEGNEDESHDIVPEDIEKSLLESPKPAKNEPEPEQEVPSGPKSRLVIHKLVLINFKSYAGRQEIGPFHKVLDFDFKPGNIC